MYGTKEIETEFLSNNDKKAINLNKENISNLEEDYSKMEDETLMDSNLDSFNNTYFEKNSSVKDNETLQTEKIKKKENKKKVQIITDEFLEEIEAMVDKQFEAEYEKINKEYEEKLEEVLNEQEEVYKKNEMLKAKYNALEKYLKNYCKKANIDYDSLI